MYGSLLFDNVTLPESIARNLYKDFKGGKKLHLKWTYDSPEVRQDGTIGKLVPPIQEKGPARQVYSLDISGLDGLINKAKNTCPKT